MHKIVFRRFPFFFRVHTCNHTNSLAHTPAHSMSLGHKIVFRLASKHSASPAASQPASTQEQQVLPVESTDQSAVLPAGARSMSPRLLVEAKLDRIDVDSTSVAVAAEIGSAMAELRQRAYHNAPRCGGRNSHNVLEWMTISQAVDTFRISKRTLSTWATHGFIPSIKGDAVNSHRLVHIDGILAHMQSLLLSAKEASLRASDETNELDIVESHNSGEDTDAAGNDDKDDEDDEDDEDDDDKDKTMQDAYGSNPQVVAPGPIITSKSI